MPDELCDFLKIVVRAAFFPRLCAHAIVGIKVHPLPTLILWIVYAHFDGRWVMVGG
jgi:hypothetical protein